MSTATEHLVVRAGSTARRILEREGFQADRFSLMVGASGGPKWLVLSQMDRIWIQTFLRRRSKPLHMLGSSIGSFRHAAFATADPASAIDRLEEGYIAQDYGEEVRPTQQFVTDTTRGILEFMLGPSGAKESATNPLLQSHVVTARWRAEALRRGMGLRLGLGASALANSFSRRTLDAFFERVVFGPDHGGPILPGRRTSLSADNLLHAILASGSIPLVMEPVPTPPAAPEGFYFDGGIIDYHFDFEFAAAGSAHPAASEEDTELVLFPHFFDRIIPGWFDKPFPWRRPSAASLDRVVMVAPSPSFVASLPGGKVPDRVDFEAIGTKERQDRWREVISRCEALAEELDALLSGDGFAGRAIPF